MTRTYVTPFLDQNLSITIHGTTPATYYYSQDGLGSVRTLTDAAGVLQNKHDYSAFGMTWPMDSIEGVVAGTIATANSASDNSLTFLSNPYAHALSYGNSSSVPWLDGIRDVLVSTDERVWSQVKRAAATSAQCSIGRRDDGFHGDHRVRLGREVGLPRTTRTIVAAIAVIVGCGRTGPSVDATGLDPKMRALIERLADVYKSPITIGGEAVLYQPKEDKTVRREILLQGFDAVPALIWGLRHPNAEIAGHCAALLRRVPRRSGVEALVEYLRVGKASPSIVQSAHSSLHELTGDSRFAPPGGVFQPDVVKVREIWTAWWAANGDRLVDTEDGIGLVAEDGSVKPLAKIDPPNEYFQ